MLSNEEINKIAHLARLELSEKEKKQYAEQLSIVFDYVKMLEEVDTEGVAETCQVTGLEDVLRDDVVKECSEETRKKLIAKYTSRSDDLLKVKNVLEDYLCI